MNKLKILIIFCLINIKMYGMRHEYDGRQLLNYSYSSSSPNINNSQQFAQLYSDYQELLRNFQQLQNQNLQLQQQMQTQRLQLEDQNFQLKQQISILEKKIDLLLNKPVAQFKPINFDKTDQ